MKLRKSRTDDQEQIGKAKDIIIDAMRQHSIHGTIWVAAFTALIARAFHESDMPCEAYVVEMNAAANHYKKLWYP